MIFWGGQVVQAICGRHDYLMKNNKLVLACLDFVSIIKKLPTVLRMRIISAISKKSAISMEER